MGILQNIRLTRRQDEVLHEKQFAWSLGFVSLLAGIVVGVISVGIELSKLGARKHMIENRLAFGVMAVLALYCVYLIYPYMKSTRRTASKKADIKLMDGTELYEDWGGRYRDNYGHHYEEVDGKYVQMD